MKKYLNEEKLLEGITCDDDLREYIHTDLQNQRIMNDNVNHDLEGVQPELKKPSKNRTEIDNENNKNVDPTGGGDQEIKQDEEREKEIILINRTYELCKTFLFPLITLLEKIDDFNEVIEITLKNYFIFTKIMNTILENNLEIINSIKEIYRTDTITVRKMIENILYLLKKKKKIMLKYLHQLF
jgi:hypothetical protein